MTDRAYHSWLVALLIVIGTSLLVGASLLCFTWRGGDTSGVAVKPVQAAEEPADNGKRPAIPYSDLNNKYDILGKTGVPLGELMSLQGSVEDGPKKGYENGPTIRVQRINGISTQAEVLLKLRPFPTAQEAFKSLVLGKTYELRGYEQGKYIGIPFAAFQELGHIAQTASPYFGVDFVVVKAKELPVIRFGPADFLNRVAFVEGMTRTADGKGYLEGSSWKLLVLDYAGWPPHMEGKLVEAEGVVRGTAQGKDVFRLENGKPHLVRLEDQRGREVELTGQAWSLNGHWWFQYRGTDLYVEDMHKLPNWTVENHGRNLVIVGVLDEAMLPRIDQITLQEDRDLMKYFIVRKASWRTVQRLELK